jgi:hypothetical protein
MFLLRYGASTLLAIFHSPVSAAIDLLIWTSVSDLLPLLCRLCFAASTLLPHLSRYCSAVCAAAAPVFATAASFLPRPLL